MRTTLAVETLKTDEPLTIECVVPPEETRAAQIRPFLAHKPLHYRAHIEAAFAGQCDDLETRFYVGLLNDEVVGNIMTVEANGIGILGHVHTREDQRRKGICDAIMRHQMEDFRRRNGHVLLLGTGYQSPAYHIYARHGFRDWADGKPGLMRYDVEPQRLFETEFFAPDTRVPTPAQWKHWPLVALLAASPELPYLRSLALNVWGATFLEGPYCQFMAFQSRSANTTASVLENERGAVVAFATCAPDTRWPGVYLLDMFARPTVTAASLMNLLESLSLPDGKIQCYADTNDAQKITVLQELGLRRVAVLPAQYRANDARDSWRDIELYARNEEE